MVKLAGLGVRPGAGRHAACRRLCSTTRTGTAKREAWRQFYLGTVAPLGRVVERELSDKFGVPVRLRFDLYNFDLAGRAAAFQKLVTGGVAVSEALATSGLLADE